MIDGAVIGLYCAAILALGFSAKVRDSSLSQYLVAGRALTLPAAVATLVSTWYGGILGISESVSYFGTGTLLLMGIPYYVFALIYAVFLAKKVRSAEQISIPERIARDYGKPAGKVAAALVFLLAVPAAHVLMLGVILQWITGLSLFWSVLIAVIAGSAFLFRGGLLADVRASMLAFVAMYVGFAAIALFCLTQHPPAQAFTSLNGSPLLTWNGGQSVSVILSFFILGLWTLVDPAFHQRVAATESPETGQKTVLVSVLFWMLFDLLSITVALYGLVLIKAQIDPKVAFLQFGSEVLPPGLRGLFMCGILGTVICALVGYSLVSGASFSRDLMGKENPRHTWGGVVLALFIAAVLALKIESVVALWYSWAGLIVGALFIPVVGSYLGWEFLKKRGTVFASLSISALGSLSLFIWGNATNNPGINIRLLNTDFSVGTLLPGILLSAVCIAVGYLWPTKRM